MIDWEFNFYAKTPDGVWPVKEEEIWKLNEQGVDIHFTPQEFNGFGLRKKSDLKSIRCFCADFDYMNLKQLQKILDDVLEPTMIVKTRNGFHVYWALVSPIPAQENIDLLYRGYIEKYFLRLGADPQAKDVSRLLRYPTTRYWYDSKNNKYEDPMILNELVYQNNDNKYWLQQFDERFVAKPEVYKPKEFLRPARPAKQFESDGKDFWKAANEYDCLEGLTKLSGSADVGGETYSFKKESSVTRIICNNKPSNAWIDSSGKIGSIVGAGPTLVNWLMYYGNSEAQAAKIMKSLMGWKDV